MIVIDTTGYDLKNCKVAITLNAYYYLKQYFYVKF